jgi:hypothetical protein
LADPASDEPIVPNRISPDPFFHRRSIMRKLLALSAVAMFAAVTTGCNCCDFSCFRRTAAMPVYAQCAPVQAQCAPDPCAQPTLGAPAYTSPSIVPGPIVTQ